MWNFLKGLWNKLWDVVETTPAWAWLLTVSLLVIAAAVLLDNLGEVRSEVEALRIEKAFVANDLDRAESELLALDWEVKEYRRRVQAAVRRTETVIHRHQTVAGNLMGPDDRLFPNVTPAEAFTVLNHLEDTLIAYEELARLDPEAVTDDGIAEAAWKTLAEKRRALSEILAQAAAAEPPAPGGGTLR